MTPNTQPPSTETSALTRLGRGLKTALLAVTIVVGFTAVGVSILVGKDDTGIARHPGRPYALNLDTGCFRHLEGRFFSPLKQFPCLDAKELEDVKNGIANPGASAKIKHVSDVYDQKLKAFFEPKSATEAVSIGPVRSLEISIKAAKDLADTHLPKIRDFFMGAGESTKEAVPETAEPASK